MMPWKLIAPAVLALAGSAALAPPPPSDAETLTSAVSRSLGGLRVVKVHHAEGYERRRFADINRRVIAQEMKARTVRALSSPVIETLGVVAVMGVALLAAHLAFNVSGGTEPASITKVLIALAIAAITALTFARAERREKLLGG